MESNKTRLHKKINNKKNKRTGKDSSDGKFDENSIFTMLNQVNKMLSGNPKMVKNVSKCVNNIFENKSLMESLVSEIENNIKIEPDDPEGSEETEGSGEFEVQTEDQESDALVNNSETVDPAASE